LLTSVCRVPLDPLAEQVVHFRDPRLSARVQRREPPRSGRQILADSRTIGLDNEEGTKTVSAPEVEDVSRQDALALYDRWPLFISSRADARVKRVSEHLPRSFEQGCDLTW
jgi:hypothetical protein